MPAGMPLLSSQSGEMSNNPPATHASLEGAPESAFDMEASVTSHGSHNTFYGLDL